MKKREHVAPPLMLIVGFDGGAVTEYPVAGDEVFEIRSSTGGILWTFTLEGVTNLVLTEGIAT